MLTLLPALLVICRPLGVLAGCARRTARADHTETGVWARVGSRIARRPRTTWVVTALVLGVASLGILQLNATGLKNKDPFYGTPDSVVGEEVLARHFPAGSGQPGRRDHQGRQGRRGHAPRSRTPPASTAVAPTGRQGRPRLLQGTLTDPADSQAAKDTVGPGAGRGARGARGRRQVGGGTAIVLDTLRASPTDNRVIIPIVLVVVFLILVLLLRALVAPLMLVATVVLSFAAALGLSALVFNHVFGFAGADSVAAAVRVRVPGRARDRLQHLPDDPGARGGARCSARGAAR